MDPANRRSLPLRGARFLRFRAGLVLDSVRQSAGRRTVNMTPNEGIRVGNFLYFWLWGHVHQTEAVEHRVLRTPAMSSWLKVFPRIEPLLIEPQEVRFMDARRLDWFQVFSDYGGPALVDFVNSRLLRSHLPIVTNVGDEVVTLNVRRGDYYSDPRHRAAYGLDIRAYVRAALNGSREQLPIERVDVVSDDPEWCQQQMPFLAEYGETTFQRSGHDPVANLAQLASSRRLVLANSTFSYWGGYISNAVHGDNHELVWAPDFHRRGLIDGTAFQLDPRWSVVNNAETMGERDPSRW